LRAAYFAKSSLLSILLLYRAGR